MTSPSSSPTLPRWLILLLASAVGVIAANLYYAQPLTAPISKALGIPAEAAGLVVTLTQVGYGLGVLCLVPLGDMLESRRLVISLMGVSLLGLLGLAFVDQPIPYFVAAFATGVGSAGVQVIIPYAAHIAPAEIRGRVIGSLMSGLMIGIMLSRPTASFLTDLISWHAVFVLSAVLMCIIAAVLYALLPPKEPTNKNIRYFPLLGSMLNLFLTQPVLRRRAIYQAFLFGAFCLFWTASPLYLAGPDFGFSQSVIALFALAGVSGAISAPFAGRAADLGLTKIATTIALLVSAGSFFLSHLFTSGTTASFVMLVIAAILLDAGITANLVLGQRAIFSLGDEIRGRLNALYIATIFVGGATGSSLGAWAYARGGWNLTSWVGFALPIAAFLFFLTERKGEAKAVTA